ncbi:MAG: hypothetical protein CSA36_05340 [Draconibacterium sp.]|nr:MAG: hypothetical protein CSA36_05340 [Draconibacterium sp.]
MKNESIVAVITGDLINSSLLEDKQKEEMESHLIAFLEKTGVLLSIKFFRGDSFQLMVEKDKAAYTAVIVQAIIFSTTGTWARLSIGIGTFSHIVEDNVLRSQGEAFELSGHQLDRMKTEGRLLRIAIVDDDFQMIIDASLYLLESIIKEWKPGQAAVIVQLPYANTQKEIAAKLGISEAAVSKSLKTSNWHAIEAFINAFEKIINNVFK